MRAQKDQVVYNKRYNTIGVILDVYTNGDIRTDADGIVYASDLKILKTEDEISVLSKIINASIAPSTEEYIKTNNLFNNGSN